jgi:hypothetical protein
MVKGFLALDNEPILSRITCKNIASGVNDKVRDIGNNVKLFSGTRVQCLARQKHPVDGLVRQTCALVQNTSEPSGIMFKSGVKFIHLSDRGKLITRRTPEYTVNEEFRKWGSIPYITC